MSTMSKQAFYARKKKWFGGLRGHESNRRVLKFDVKMSNADPKKLDQCLYELMLCWWPFRMVRS